METLFDVLHVVTAVFLVGPMAILPMTAIRGLRSGDAEQVRRLAKSTSVISLLSLLVVIFGFGLLGVSDPKHHLSVTTPWILISLIAYVVALVLNLFVVVPALRSAAGALRNPQAGSGRSWSYSQMTALSGSVSLLLVVAVILMVAKP